MDVNNVTIRPEMVGVMDQAYQAGRDKLGELVEEARRLVDERGPAAAATLLTLAHWERSGRDSEALAGVVALLLVELARREAE